MKVGQVAEARLKENPTTGYRWWVRQNGEPWDIASLQDRSCRMARRPTARARWGACLAHRSQADGELPHRLDEHAAVDGRAAVPPLYDASLQASGQAASILMILLQLTCYQFAFAKGTTSSLSSAMVTLGTPFGCTSFQP